MLYRCLRKIDTGQWVNVLFTVDGENFSVPEESHRTGVAAALGLLPEALETVDGGLDQRTGVLLEMPLSPKPERTRIEELLDIPRSNWTTAQLRELIELAARGEV